MCAHPNNSASCDDGFLLYQLAHQCSSGSCGGVHRDCSAAGDQCNDGVCNEATDTCDAQQKPVGTSCDDGVLLQRD